MYQAFKTTKIHFFPLLNFTPRPAAREGENQNFKAWERGEEEALTLREALGELLNPWRRWRWKNGAWRWKNLGAMEEGDGSAKRGKKRVKSDTRGPMSCLIYSLNHCLRIDLILLERNYIWKLCDIFNYICDFVWFLFVKRDSMRIDDSITCHTETCQKWTKY